MLQGFQADVGDELADALGPDVVADLGLPLLAQADGDHLHQAALVRARVDRVGLDPVDDDDTVRLERVRVDHHGHAEPRRGAHLHHVHARSDRGAGERFGDPEVLEQGLLALRGGPAVAAHGRDDERPRPRRLELADDETGHLGEAGDSAAAHGDRDLGSARDGPQDVLFRQPVQERAFDVVDLRPFEALRDPYHSGDGDVPEEVVDTAHRLFVLSLARREHDPFENRFCRRSLPAGSGAVKVARAGDGVPGTNCLTPSGKPCRIGDDPNFVKGGQA